MKRPPGPQLIPGEPGRAEDLNAVTGSVNYLRDAGTSGNQVTEGEETLAAAYRRYSGQLSRAWALSSGAGSQELEARQTHTRTPAFQQRQLSPM